MYKTLKKIHYQVLIIRYNKTYILPLQVKTYLAIIYKAIIHLKTP